MSDLKFELRFADTGHCHTFFYSNVNTISMLMSMIKSQYKIQKEDQLLMTRSGQLAKQDDCDSFDRLRFVAPKYDKTIIKVEPPQADNIQMGSILCLYLFNDRSLSRPVEKLEQRADSSWVKELRAEIYSQNGMRQSVYELLSLTSRFSSDQLQLLCRSSGKVIANAKSLHERYHHVVGMFLNFKEIKMKVENVERLCDNQRKAAMVLIKNLQVTFNKSLQGKAEKLKEKIGKCKGEYSDKMLRENSSFFQSKKKQDDIAAIIRTRGQQAIASYSAAAREMKHQVKATKLRFREPDSSMVKIDEQLSQNFKRCEQIYRIINDNYNKMVEMLECLLNSTDQKVYRETVVKLEQLIEEQMDAMEGQYRKPIEAMREQGERDYVELRKINEVNQYKLRESYQIYKKWVHELAGLEQEIAELQRMLTVEQKNLFNIADSTLKDSELCDVDTAEISRRLRFNKRIREIQSYVKNLLQDQQMLRKNYVKEFSCAKEVKDGKGSKAKQSKSKDGRASPIQTRLTNCKVPSITLNYEGTSDLELLKSQQDGKELQISLLGMLCSQEQTIAELNSIFSMNRQFLSERSDVSSRMRNMQTIMEKSSEIFQKLFSGRVARIQQEANSRIELIVKKQKEMQLVKDGWEQAKISLQNDLQKIKKNADKQQKVHEEQEKVLQVKNDEIGNQLRTCKRQLSKQVEIMQAIVDQLEETKSAKEYLQRQVDNLKLILAQKQLQFIKMEQRDSAFQASGNLQQSSESMPCFVESKVEVISKAEMTSVREDQYKAIIERLTVQIETLKQDNVFLEEEIQVTRDELNRIILCPTDDQQVQVDMQESSTGKRESDKAITIEEDLSLGQLALFMPFSSNVYVAVRTKDESRDGQQTHEWTTEPRLTGYNYVLDLGYYNLKTKDLLRYMQPNIVSAHFSWLCGCRRSSIMNRRIWSREGYSTLWDSRTITLPLRIMHLLCLAYTDDCVDCLTNIIINMFLFESSKEKEVRLATQSQLEICLSNPTNSRKYTDAMQAISRTISSSNETVIEQVVGHIKQTIKNEDYQPVRKYQAILLLKDIMKTHNKALGKYVVKKILKRLTIFAQHKSNTPMAKDEERGKDIFGEAKKDQQIYAIRFLNTLLMAVEQWSKSWPKAPDGPHQDFHAAYNELLINHVQFPKEIPKEAQKGLSPSPSYTLKEQSKSPPPRLREKSANKDLSSSLTIRGQLQNDLKKHFQQIKNSLTLLSDMLSGSNAEIIPVIKDIVVSLTKTIEKSDEFFERLESQPNSSYQKEQIQKLELTFEFRDKISKDMRILEKKNAQFEVFKNKYIKQIKKLGQTLKSSDTESPFPSQISKVEKNNASSPSKLMERNQNDAIKVETVEPKIKEQNQFNSTNRLTIQIEQAKREPEFNSNSHNSVNSGVLHGSATPSGLTERAKEQQSERGKDKKMIDVSIQGRTDSKEPIQIKNPSKLEQKQTIHIMTTKTPKVTTKNPIVQVIQQGIESKRKIGQQSVVNHSTIDKWNDKPSELDFFKVIQKKESDTKVNEASLHKQSNQSSKITSKNLLDLRQREKDVTLGLSVFDVSKPNQSSSMNRSDEVSEIKAKFKGNQGLITNKMLQEPSFMKLASEKMTSEMKSPFNNSTFHKISTIVPKERPGRSDENYFQEQENNKSFNPFETSHDGQSVKAGENPWVTGKFPEKVEKDSKSNPFDSESNRSEKRKNPFSSCSDSGNMNQSSVSNPFETSSLKGGQINPFQKKATNPFEQGDNQLRQSKQKAGASLFENDPIRSSFMLIGVDKPKEEFKGFAFDDFQKNKSFEHTQKKESVKNEPEKQQFSISQFDKIRNSKGKMDDFGLNFSQFENIRESKGKINEQSLNFKQFENVSGSNGQGDSPPLSFSQFGNVRESIVKIKEPGLTFSQFGNFENTSEQKQDASGFGLSQFESVPLEDPKIQARKSAISFSKNIESSVDVFAKFANPSANKDPSVETSFNQDKNAKFIESKDLTLNSKAAPIVSNKAVEYFFPEASKQFKEQRNSKSGEFGFNFSNFEAVADSSVQQDNTQRNRKEPSVDFFATERDKNQSLDRSQNSHHEMKRCFSNNRLGNQQAQRDQKNNGNQATYFEREKTVKSVEMHKESDSGKESGPTQPAKIDLQKEAEVSSDKPMKTNNEALSVNWADFPSYNQVSSEKSHTRRAKDEASQWAREQEKLQQQIQQRELALREIKKQYGKPNYGNEEKKLEQAPKQKIVSYVPKACLAWQPLPEVKAASIPIKMGSVSEKELQDAKSILLERKSRYSEKLKEHAQAQEQYNTIRQLYYGKIGMISQFQKQKEQYESMLKAVRSANDRKEEAVIAIKHKISQVEGLKNKILAKQKQLYDFIGQNNQKANSKPSTTRSKTEKWEMFNRNMQEQRNNVQCSSLSRHTYVAALSRQ